VQCHGELATCCILTSAANYSVLYHTNISTLVNRNVDEQSNLVQLTHGTYHNCNERKQLASAALCLLLALTLKTKAMCFSETMVNFYQPA
jgi:hypothetical protein